jgi:hypothetical protein
MLRSKVPSFKIHGSILHPVLIWRRGGRYDVVDSANVPSGFEKLRPVEAKVSRAGKTQRMTLRVFADRSRSAQTLSVSTPAPVRKGSLTHRGRKFRIRAPQNFGDCGYARLLDRLIEDDACVDALLGDFRPELKVVPGPACPSKNHHGAILFMPGAGKLTCKGKNSGKVARTKARGNPSDGRQVLEGHENWVICTADDIYKMIDEEFA